MGKTNLDDLETSGDVTVKGGDIILDDTDISEAEIVVLDAVTPGTSKANAAAVLGANKNLDVLALPVSGLKIGAGAGTAVDRTAAELNALAQGVAAGYKIARGEAVLDGSNPTTIVTGLAAVVAFVATLKGNSAPGDNTSILTVNPNATDGSFDVYAWKNTGGTDPTLVASTGAESFYWIAIGT